MDEVVVLMSTYNGEKFIREQLDSILNQKNVKVNLIVRDDGSTDGTKVILSEYQRRFDIKVYYEQNIGVRASFLKLIDIAPKCNFYALADQDDAWYDDKLICAVNLLEEYQQDIPLLYGANQDCVDKDLNFLAKHFEQDLSGRIDLNSVITNNLIAGCTMVFNQAMLQCLRKDDKLRDIAYFRMHDTWLMIEALLHGRFVYDHRACMQYRRHGDNFSDGSFNNESLVVMYLKKLRKLVCSDAERGGSRTAKLILANELVLSESEVFHLKLCANYHRDIFDKVKLLWHIRDLHSYRYPDWVMFAKVLFNRY